MQCGGAWAFSGLVSKMPHMELIRTSFCNIRYTSKVNASSIHHLVQLASAFSSYLSRIIQARPIKYIPPSLRQTPPTHPSFSIAAEDNYQTNRPRSQEKKDDRCSTPISPCHKNHPQPPHLWRLSRLNSSTIVVVVRHLRRAQQMSIQEGQTTTQFCRPYPGHLSTACLFHENLRPELEVAGQVQA